MAELEDLRCRIEKLRLQMTDLVNRTGSLVDPAVVIISKKLDVLIVEYHRRYILEKRKEYVIQKIN